MSEERLMLTPQEAESLLLDGDNVHNLLQAGFGLIGCDYSRADAIKAFEEADEIEIGGEQCKAMKHPIAAHKGGKVFFFEADMDKVAAFEAKP